MKKINRKAKLITLISITIIVIILVIVITKNIEKIIKIGNQEYFEMKANAGSNIVANYIKAGLTIGGITGTYTKDATATAEDILEGKTAYVNGEKITGTYNNSSNDNDTLGTVTGNETENTYVNDKYGNQVVVPAGFKIINPEDNVTDGIIIEDVSAGDENTKGSQFVWIPIGKVIKDANGSETEIKLQRYDFNNDGTTTAVPREYEEYTLENDSPTYKNAIAKDLYDFIVKSITNHGYYIGRYEAGDATAIDEARDSSSSNDNPIVSKSGVYPYNYITQSQASSLCQGMYSNSNFESDLINSYAWDTAIVFIQTFSNDNDYSVQKSLEADVTKCGEATDGINNDVRCNIYDMAGNTSEWSTETYTDQYVCCTYRGSGYSYNKYTKSRFYALVNDDRTRLLEISFRTILYV